MRILMVSTELVPVAKVGGLADMVGSLARALIGLGHDVRCALPRYRLVDDSLPAEAKVVDRQTLSFPLQGAMTECTVFRVEHEVLPAPLLLVDHPLFRRHGVYDDPDTREGWPDNGLRWAVFCRAVHAAILEGEWSPEIVHAHDHQAAPLVGLLRWSTGPGVPRHPGTVFTLHNLGYQGIEPPYWIAESGLPWEMYYPTGPLEFHGNVNLMKIGVEAADRLTTVSPRYAEEIRMSEEFSGGLQGALETRADRLTGILNGIDTEVWDPASDPHLPFHYSAERPVNKSRNRAALRKELGLKVPHEAVPLAGMVGRLASQKGLDLLLAVIEPFLDTGAQMAILGSGESRFETSLMEIQARYPGRLAVRIGFDEGLAHRIEAGSDLFVMPSRYEPCGLNQLYSLRYGTVPVVRAVGGLSDTVIDLDEFPGQANGFVFRLYEPVELFKTLHRALRAWRNRKLWRELVRRGMHADFSWDRSAHAYLEVYEEALADAN